MPGRHISDGRKPAGLRPLNFQSVKTGGMAFVNMPPDNACRYKRRRNGL